MNQKEIEILLEKYWEAETSLAEEQALKDYFLGGDIANDHLSYAPMFTFFSESKDLVFQEKHSEIKVVRLWDRFRFSARKNVLGIAASLLLLLTAGIFMINENFNQNTYSGNYVNITEEEEALEVTMQALAFLGAKLDESSRNITSDVQKMKKVKILK